MRRAFIATAAWLTIAASHQAKSPFTGTWVAGLDSQSVLGTDVYLVKDGSYSCTSCDPPRTYPIDGNPHKIGDAEGTSESVTIAGRRTIVTRIVQRAMTRVTTMTVASNDRTATYVSVDHRPGIKQSLKTVYLARRVAPAPPGSHPVSGTWQGVRYVAVPELVRTTELRDDGRVFAYRVPIGVHYEAPFGGTFVPVSGPYKGMSAAVKRDGARRIVETRKQGDKVILIRTFTVSRDGRRLTTVSRSPESGSDFSITAHRKR